MNRETIRIIDNVGTQLDVELISILNKDDKKYLIYTKGEKQKNGSFVLYVSKLIIKEGTYYLINIMDDKEWVSVKKIMGSIVDK